MSFPVGTVLLVSAWHANRDGVETDGFDISADRGRTRALTFGAGIHYCVGANLARAEMEEALVALAQQVQQLAIADEPQYASASGIYGLESLPLQIRRGL